VFDTRRLEQRFFIAKMKFNFPKYEECVVANIKLDKSLFNAIKMIAEEQEVMWHDAIVTLLEAAVVEYVNQYHLGCKFWNDMGGICLIALAAKRAKAERKCALQHYQSSRFGSVGCSTQIARSPA
jgi:hypothetical protein